MFITKSTWVLFPHFHASFCVRLLEISFDNRQIHSLRKIHNHRSFFISVPALYLPIICSSPMFSSPTCPLSLHLELCSPVLIYFLSNHPGLAKNHFSPSCCCQPVQHTCLLYLVFTLLPPVSWSLVCLTPPRQFQTAPPLPQFFCHFFFHQLYFRIVCSHFQCFSF